ncbi:MAG: SusC/RagA family TonB-linked outer membrane protein, partial [Prevotellaceae bacterium]|jgi:TonB-linked SusC/RagA family outer membrane protein|nr:SusC/RagA family TonB-linked outer membrane protein [Prevotellaceae bacterium]
VKGTTVAVLTDGEGRYTITVPENTTLVFSFVGMQTQEVEVGARTVINVELLVEAKRLEDVVVIGYGSARKISSVVGSVAYVNSEKLSEKPIANITDALQGRVAGLLVLSSSGEPSSLSTMQLHGMGSLNASTTPLYIVDGFPVSGDALRSLNANDFESINVLKDASATSIYGSRAANGVVYITTKQGKSGEATITARAQYGISTLADGGKSFERVMNAKELLALQYEFGVNNMTQATYDSLLNSGTDTKWYKYFFKDNAPTFEADVTLQGGNEDKIRYYISNAYFNQDGLTTHSLYERYSFRANVEAKPKNWLKIGLNANGSYAKIETDGYAYQAGNTGYSVSLLSFYLPPYYSPYDKDGNEREYFDDAGVYNIKHLQNQQIRSTNDMSIVGNAFVEIKPFKGFTARSQFGLEFIDRRYSYKRLASKAPWEDNGSATETFARFPTLTTTNTLEYRFNITDDHEVSVLAGHEGIKYSGSSFGMSTSGHTDDRLLLLTAGPTKGEPTHAISEYAYLSFFGTLDYNYKEKYFLALSLRTDGSSRFGKDRKWGNFYSAGLMWNAKSEEFLKDIDILSGLTFKASLGTTGNSSGWDNVNYAHLATVGTSRYNGNTVWGLSSSGNPELGWETQRLLTIGVAAEFLERFKIEVEYYNRTTLDMIMDVPVPLTTGWADITSNIGSIANNGIDMTLGLAFVKTENWLVELNATFNYNVDKVIELFYGFEEWPMPSYLLNYQVGNRIEFYAPVYAGVNPANGKQLWKIPGTNEVTETYDEEALYQNTGKPYVPTFSGGFELAATWKNIYASAFFSWAGEKYLVNNDRYFYENQEFFKSGDNQLATIKNMWRQPGDITDIPKFGETAHFDTHLLENASFMRLKNLTVGYNFPTKLLNKTRFFSAAKVYFTARNLFTWTNYTGPDPEIDSNLTYAAFPNTRQFVCGINFSF